MRRRTPAHLCGPVTRRPLVIPPAPTGPGGSVASPNASHFDRSWTRRAELDRDETAWRNFAAPRDRASGAEVPSRPGGQLYHPAEGRDYLAHRRQRPRPNDTNAFMPPDLFRTRSSPSRKVAGQVRAVGGPVQSPEPRLGHGRAAPRRQRRDNHTRPSRHLRELLDSRPPGAVTAADRWRGRTENITFSTPSSGLRIRWHSIDDL